jgi:hypothetical protein
MSNWKSYIFLIALIGIISYTGLIKIKNINLEHKLQLCNASYASLQDKVKIANERRDEQEKKLRLREQEAAQARAESLKRKDSIMKENVPQDCNGAIQWMTAQSSRLSYF